MSYSQLFIINKELKVEELKSYQNSWLFPIKVGNYLANQYATDEEKAAEINKQRNYYHFAEKDINKEAPFNILSLFSFDVDGQNFKRLNGRINNSKDLIDRIGWELVMQQMFETNSKDIVANAVEELQKCCNGDEERFKTIAADIRSIDETKCPYFIFKNNTIDDTVERFFERYNEEADEMENISLRETEYELQFDVVEIKDGKMFFGNPYEELQIEKGEKTHD